jgi:hypothetical protein
MRQEIGDRCEAGKNEGHRPGEEADREQDASDQFNQPTHTRKRRDRNIGKHRRGRKAEDLCRTVLKQAQAREDAKDAEQAEPIRHGKDAVHGEVSG